MPRAISLEAKVTVPADVLRQELNGESVVLNVVQGCYYGLDPVANSMWNALTASGSLLAALDRLQAEFDVDSERLQNDLLEFTANLADHGLLEIHADDQQVP